MYINPSPSSVSSLASAMESSNTAICAHFYMDVELQGVLQALPNQKRVFIGDSLAMGDAAVRMCEDGADAIVCLGVDFMSESVSSIMAKAGYGHIPVYRSTSRKIGCSLAESAERLSYSAWLHKAASHPNPLHVVYINTSLESKAQSNNIVPTVTCTSSNVVKTILQAQLQIPDVSVWYGPDTCMGYNLQTMLDKVLANWSDEEIKEKLHPEHDRESVGKLRENLHVYPEGNCVVHQIFGDQVVNDVKEHYPDAYVTAHLEVPGEMFEIAMEYSLHGRGVTGSTSDILNFITRKVEEAAKGEMGEGKKTLKFILGTEAGMVTSVVKNVKEILRTVPGARDRVEAEIVFPVASEAVAIDDAAEGGIVPGVAGGEGCGTNGGCATCPFMKMNELDAVADVMNMYEEGKGKGLEKYLPPKRLEGKTVGGRDATEVGVECILRMRELMGKGELGDELVDKVKDWTPKELMKKEGSQKRVIQQVETETVKRVSVVG